MRDPAAPAWRLPDAGRRRAASSSTSARRATCSARVGSYFRAEQVHPKVMALVSQVAGDRGHRHQLGDRGAAARAQPDQAHRPRYNVLLRDDKSFPYMHLSAHEFPRLSFYRGTRKLPGRLFGPYPMPARCTETLNQLHKLFRLRSCQDSFFANRSRPCLEYQIKRCSAPCTGLISRRRLRARRCRPPCWCSRGVPPKSACALASEMDAGRGEARI